jgi:hypothetical protein
MRPIASPVSFAPQTAPLIVAQRQAAFDVELHQHQAERWAMKSGVRPMEPGWPSTLNSAMLPSVAA